MILSKDNLEIKDLSLKRVRKFSNGFKFYPLVYKNNQVLIQTPLLYIPYGIQTIDTKKYINISTINHSNDINIKHFIKNIKNIELYLKQHFNKYQLVNILKKDDIRLRLYNCLFFNEHKQIINDIPSNVYGNFIINIYGVWNKNDICYIQCYLLQCKICMPFYLTQYGFLEDKIKNIPPPPPLPVNLIKKYERTISKPKIKQDSNFKPPSLLEIKSILQNLKKKTL